MPTDRVLRADCGTLTVPLDPAQPALGTVTLGVVRAGLADAPGRTPLAAPPAAARARATPPPTRRRGGPSGWPRRCRRTCSPSYAIIGLDRRGAGTDTLDCADPVRAQRARGRRPGHGWTPPLLLERARAVVQACNVALDGQLGGFSSEAAADDIEAVRQALGVARLSALGTGDGAEALADWARAHPRAVGGSSWTARPTRSSTSPRARRPRAQATEAAFDAFAQRCTSRSACPLGADPRTAVTALVTSLRAQPLNTPDGRQLSAGTAVTAIRVALGEPSSWAALTDALQAARAGDPGRSSTGSPRPSARAGRYDAALATDCNDAQNRIAPAQIQDLARQWQTAYPLFGSSVAADLVACAPWPTGGGRAPAAVPPDLPPLDGDRHGGGSASVDGRRPGRRPVAAVGRVHRVAGRGDRRLPAHAMRELARGQHAGGRPGTGGGHLCPP